MIRKTHFLRTTFIAIVLTLNTAVFGQIFPKTDWSINELKGKVKNLKITYHRPINKFGEITKSDEYYAEETKKFDTKGNIIECTNSDTAAFSGQWINIYDNQGKISEYNVYDLQKELVKKNIYKYDNSTGNLIEVDVYNGDDGSLYQKTIFKYGENGNENIIQVDYDNDGDLVSKYIYDAKGKILEISEYSYGYDSKQYKYIYDETEKKIELEVSQRRHLINKYKYNDKGDEIYQYSYEKDDNYEDVETLDYSGTYKYDNQNNWVEWIVYKSMAKIPVSIVVREIEYYK